MPIYQYIAIHKTSREIVRDELECASLLATHRALKERSLLLLSARRKFPIFEDHFGAISQAQLLRGIAFLLRSGIPLREALLLLRQDEPSALIRRLLEKLSREIASGLRFSEALATNARYFSETVRVLIRLGEETGALEVGFEKAALHLETRQQLIKATQRALIYPTVVFLSMFAVLSFWMLYLLPEILNILPTLGMKTVPVTTQFLMMLSAGFSQYWMLLPGCIVGLGAFWSLAMVNQTAAAYFERSCFSIPGLRTLLHASQLAFLFEHLSVFYAAGLTFLQSLELMRASSKSPRIRRGLQELQNKLIRGSTLTDACRETKLFDASCLRLLRVGEASNSLEEQLHRLASLYQQKTIEAVTVFSKTLEPALIAVAGGIFILLVIGLIGPIYDAVSTVR